MGVTVQISTVHDIWLHDPHDFCVTVYTTLTYVAVFTLCLSVTFSQYSFNCLYSHVTKHVSVLYVTISYSWLTTHRRVSQPVVPSCSSWWSYRIRRALSISLLPMMVATSWSGEAGLGNRVTVRYRIRIKIQEIY